jgi:hypothetical protein
LPQRSGFALISIIFNTNKLNNKSIDLHILKVIIILKTQFKWNEMQNINVLINYFWIEEKVFKTFLIIINTKFQSL